MLSKTTLRRALLLAGAASSVAAPAVPVSAQETGPTTALEEITVTAQRREENLQDVPIAVSAFSDAALDRFEIRTVRDIQSIVPNLWMETNTGLSNGSRAALRGIGEDESFFTSDTPVGIYVDDVYIPRQTGAMFDLFEVERIEVLRGPQGTLYGRNTSAGAIKLVSRKPGDEFRANAEVTVGDYSRIDLRGSLSGPLSNTISGEISALSRQRDGYDRNLVDDSEVNDQDVVAGRVALRYAATDSFEALLSYDNIRDRSTPGYALGVAMQGTDGLGAVDLSDQVDGDSNVHTLISDLLDPINDTDQQGASLTLTWQVNDLTIKSITAWREMENTILLDADGQDSCFGLALPCLHLFQDQAQDQISQELQVQGSARGGSLTYLAGVYYFEESNDQVTENIILAQFGENPYSDTSLDTDSIAVFGSATMALSDRWNLTLGARWTEDTKDFGSAVFEANGDARLICADPATRAVYSSGPCVAGSPPGAATVPLDRQIEKSWSNVTPRVVLDYKASDDAMLYASIAEGFKSGSFDGREVGTALYNLQPIKPETVLTYEIGAKTQWLDRRLQANMAAFLNDFQDLQGTGTDQETGSFTRFSVGDVETKGVEVELTALPIDNLTITANVGFLDTEYTKVNFDQVADCGSVGTGTKDLELKFAPKLSSFLGFNYRVPLAGLGGAINFGADWTHKDSFYHSSCNPVPSRDPGYDLYNAQLSYESDDGRWLVAGAMRNLSDEDYAIGQFFIPGLAFDAVYINPPQTWSLMLRYTFE